MMCQQPGGTEDLDWQEVFYWPSSPEYAIPWLIGPAVFLVLAAIGVIGGTKPSLPVSPLGCVLACALLLIFNAVLFWAHVRPQFLTWATARRPFLGTYIVLNLVYFLIWGLILSMGDTELTLTDPDPVLTLQNVTLGFAGLTPWFLASSLWKTEEPGVTNLRIARENAKRLLRRALDNKLKEKEYEALRKALKAIANDDAALLMGRVRLEEEYRLLQAWETAAKGTFDKLNGRGYPEFLASRESLAPTLCSTRSELLKNS